jgi:hypothetical protein
MPEPKTYTGGCHCGQVRYEVTSDLARVMECNCSHCNKRGLLLTFVTPDKFTAVAGDDGLKDYQFNNHSTSFGLDRTGKHYAPTDPHNTPPNVGIWPVD